MKVIKSVLVMAVALALLVSCSPIKMRVSEPLKQAHDQYAVSGRQGLLINQKMSFGEFHTTQVQRSWTKGSEGSAVFRGIGPAAEQFVNLISLDYVNRKQTIRFELSDGRQTSAAFCVTRFNSEDLSVGKNPNSILNIGMDVLKLGGWSESTYYVQVYTADTDRPWEMLIDHQAIQAHNKTYTGLLSFSKEKYYTLVPVSDVEKKNGKTVRALAVMGFEFRDPAGKPVAAVSLIDKGMVFLGKVSAAERLLLANACTALLLQEEIG